jgi:hypothetical protein
MWAQEFDGCFMTQGSVISFIDPMAGSIVEAAIS